MFAEIYNWFTSRPNGGKGAARRTEQLAAFQSNPKSSMNAQAFRHATKPDAALLLTPPLIAQAGASPDRTLLSG